ncbi:hypothetical protein Tcan_07453 [Toxocara canis]|uniref:Uncharacterized protein n=1 Tax=Toxocara canis TaxID=6265 RepID=A0A0B2VHB7_TOXCA|nr:hypothetical protein Tcan_07453 [Toxocara canis]
MRKQLNELTICNAALHSGQNSLTEDRDFLKKHYEEREQRAELAMAKEAVRRVYNSRFEQELQARRAEFNARLTIYCERIKEMCRVKLYEADEAPEEVDDGLDESAQLRSHLQEVKDRMERQNSVVDER